MGFDPKKLHKVSSINKSPRGQKYDLALSLKTEKFRLSTKAWDKLKMDIHGLDYYEGENGEPTLQLVSDATKPAMYGRRHYQDGSGVMGKTKDATNRVMFDTLRKLYPNATKFALKVVGNDDDGLYLEVTPWDDSTGSGVKDLAVKNIPAPEAKSVAKAEGGGDAVAQTPAAAQATETQADAPAQEGEAQEATTAPTPEATPVAETSAPEDEFDVDFDEPAAEGGAVRDPFDEI